MPQMKCTTTMAAKPTDNPCGVIFCPWPPLNCVALSYVLLGGLHNHPEHFLGLSRQACLDGVREDAVGRQLPEEEAARERRQLPAWEKCNRNGEGGGTSFNRFRNENRLETWMSSDNSFRCKNCGDTGFVDLEKEVSARKVKQRTHFAGPVLIARAPRRTHVVTARIFASFFD